MQTFLFYDIETSGLNPAFDQVLTFAAIRTDLELNEIDRQTITIQLREDIVPSPGAFLTHGLTPEILSGGISEYDAAHKIHRLFNTPKTISVGYNSLKFDDEFLRFLFYRNLLDPYVHQYGNGCSRMDMLPIAAVCRVFHPQGIRWPVIEGKPSLKLEMLSTENHFKISGKAHEALSDVEALICLSQKIIQHKDMWQYCLDFFNKMRDEVRVKSIETQIAFSGQRFPLCLMVSAAFGSDVNYLAPVIPIGASVAYKNQELWLRLDSEDILGLDANLEPEETYVIRKRYGDLPVVLPALDRFMSKLPEASKEKMARNGAVIENNMSRFQSVIDYHRSFKYPVIPHIDPDAALYQAGFFSAQEKKESAGFHQAVFENKNDPSVISRISSPRVRQLASRILKRNFKQWGLKIHDAEYDQHLQSLGISLGSKSDPVVGYKGDTKYNAIQALEELNSIKQDQGRLNEAQKSLIQWLERYIHQRF